MRLELFINFNGNCREAMEFYARVFKSRVANLMTYADAPPDPSYPVPESDRDKVLYAGMPLGDMVVMFSDVPSDSEFIAGNNISPTISAGTKEEITRIFDELKEGGEVYMPLGRTFFSDWFGMVEDRFGVIWQLTQYEAEAQNP